MEETIGYEAVFSAEEWESVDLGEWKEEPHKTSLTEDDALRMARGLDDYELVSVTDLGGSAEFGYWLQIRDGRFELSYPIESHCDYWDFIAALVDHKQCVSLTPLDVPRSVPSGCELGPQDQTQTQLTPFSICVWNWVFRRQGRSVRRTTDRRRNATAFVRSLRAANSGGKQKQKQNRCRSAFATGSLAVKVAASAARPTADGILRRWRDGPARPASGRSHRSVAGVWM